MERLPNGLQRHDASKLTLAQALAIYERDKMLFIKCSKAQRKHCQKYGLQDLQTLFANHSKGFTNFTVENAVNHNRKNLTLTSVLGKSSEIEKDSGSFYVSSILQNDADTTSAFFQSMPFDVPPILQHAEHDDGVWLFLGNNPSSTKATTTTTKPTTTSTSKKKKRKTSNKASGAVIAGRPEHTDKVSHSGTWHVQVKGSKTWFIRPLIEAVEWEGTPPTLEDKQGAVDMLGGARLRIEVLSGDLFILNTKVWWHKTEIPVQHGANDQGLSFSYARDFYLDDDDEDDDDDDGDSDDAGDDDADDDNDDEDDHDNGDDDDDHEGQSSTTKHKTKSTAKASAKSGEVTSKDKSSNPITQNTKAGAKNKKGDAKSSKASAKSGKSSQNKGKEASKGWSFVDDDAGVDGKTNDSTIDPRLFAPWAIDTGELALAEEDLPDIDSIPRSAHPNCQLIVAEIDDKEQVALVASRPILIHEVFTVSLNDEDDEFEEWELDPITGEMVVVDA